VQLHTRFIMPKNMLRGAVILVALALWGCASEVSWVPSGPSATSGIDASIGPSTSAEGALFVGRMNDTRKFDDDRRHGERAFDLVISASRRVRLHQVTIRMIDGSNLGGPMVTVPQAQLVEHFGSIDIAAGARRTFTFLPGFVWTRPLHSIAAEVMFLDDVGAMRGITVEGPSH
jgi:hypothetical protein